MTKIQNANLYEMLPFNIKNDNIEAKALSYVLQQSISMLCNYSDGIRIMAVIDDMSEEVIDNLAVELNMPYYNSKSNIAIKRALLKNVFVWHLKSGTKYAIKQYLSDINSLIEGETDIQEWYEYDGLPYHFRIIFSILEDADKENISTNEIIAQINRLKNARSILDDSVYNIILNEDENAYITNDGSVITDSRGNLLIS